MAEQGKSSDPFQKLKLKVTESELVSAAKEYGNAILNKLI
jgi:hypothetical protein